MATYKQPAFSEKLYVEPSPLPDGTPQVSEIGLSSAPLETMAYYFGAFCKDYSEDFMLCKASNPDAGACLKEGRKVTRCGLDLIEKLKKNCGVEWENYWKCYDKNNHTFYPCRKEESVFDGCVFEKLGLKKTIPETPEGQTQIHLKEKPLYK